MKYQLLCSIAGEDVTLKINAECEEDAEAYALLNYQIKSVKSITTNKPQRTNNLIKDQYKHSDYPHIKNTGKSSIRIYT